MGALSTHASATLASSLGTLSTRARKVPLSTHMGTLLVLPPPMAAAVSVERSMYIHTYALHIYPYMYIYMCVSMYIYTYIYICIYMPLPSGPSARRSRKQPKLSRRRCRFGRLFGSREHRSLCPLAEKFAEAIFYAEQVGFFRSG
jgi:hypothetical protein